MWFSAKTNGIGWRLPTCWQGWAVFLGYWAVIVIGYFELCVFHHVSPLWWLLFLIGTTAALAGVCWLKGPPLRWRRGEDTGDYPPGHCQKCGYNLTGNVSGVCPECGTKIEKP